MRSFGRFLSSILFVKNTRYLHLHLHLRYLYTYTHTHPLTYYIHNFDIMDNDDGMAERIQQTITNEVMDSIRRSIAEEVSKAIAGSKRELTEISAEACASSLSELTTKAAKAARTSLSTEWKSDGNKRAYRNNEEVLEHITTAEHQLEKGNVDFAVESLKAGKSLLLKRMKHIRIADREELGWRVIRHYESDDLCDNTDDEKQLSRARRSAVADSKRRATKVKTRRPSRISARPFSDATPPAYYRRDSRPLFCFHCRREGHTRQFCYLLQKDGRRTTKGIEPSKDGQ